MRPSQIELEELFRDLRGINLPELQHRLAEALKRDAAGSVIPDGFPAQSGGGFSSDISRPTENAAIGPYKPVSRSLGEGDDGPLGPHVYRLPKDPVHEHTEAAWGWLTEAVKGLKNVERRLDLLESLTGKPPAPQLCESCLRVGVHVPMEIFSDVNGPTGPRLPRSHRLCMPCYDWVRKNTGGLPSVAYLERRHMVGARGRKRVMGKAS